MPHKIVLNEAGFLDAAMGIQFAFFVYQDEFLLRHLQVIL
jgi:hypothetical protein